MIVEKLICLKYLKIYEIAVRKQKIQMQPDHRASYGKWKEHLGFMNMNTLS